MWCGSLMMMAADADGRRQMSGCLQSQCECGVDCRRNVCCALPVHMLCYAATLVADDV